MIPSHILKSTVDGIKKITGKEIAVYDPEGTLLAASSPDSPPVIAGLTRNPIESAGQSDTHGMTEEENSEYTVVVSGDDDDNTFRKFCTFHIQALMTAYKERSDRNNFIKNVLLDNLLPADIYSHAKKLNIENNVRRVAYLIETTADTGAAKILRGIFPDRQRDFIIDPDETSIILIKELSERDGSDEIEQLARVIVDTLSSEAMSRVYAAIGTAVTDLKDVPASLKDARLAREVGKIFESEKQIVNYEKLGIGRLIYQLPLPLCRVFTNEMLQGFNLSDIDEDMFITIRKFFENDLNVSKTADKLFIHRNTLVYRLDKLQALTGLDLRKFTDAITFKITLMVNNYMEYGRN